MSFSSKQAELQFSIRSHSLHKFHFLMHKQRRGKKKKNTDSKQDRAVLLTIRKPSKSIIFYHIFLFSRRLMLKIHVEAAHGTWKVLVRAYVAG